MPYGSVYCAGAAPATPKVGRPNRSRAKVKAGRKAARRR